LPYIPKYIRNKPSFIGKLTIKYIYEQMPKGVLERIREVTPKTPKGHWKYKFHQSLTPEIGREHLRKQIIEVTTLMSISNNKEQFQELFKKKYGKEVQLQLEFSEQAENKDQQIKIFDQQLKGLLSVPPPKKEAGNKKINYESNL